MGRRYMHTEYWMSNLKERDNLEDQQLAVKENVSKTGSVSTHRTYNAQDRNSGGLNIPSCGI